MINKNIFREYDIRGIYGTDLTENTAYLIGKAFGTKLKSLNINNTVIGYDNRKSSPSLEKELIKGITECGINVIRLGLVTTPMFYYSWDTLKIKSGMMITASHNPKEYNGFKFTINGIHNSFGDDVKELYNIIMDNNFINSDSIGKIENYDIRDKYINLLVNSIKLGNRKLKVVYDCGNGTTSIIADDIFNKFTTIEAIPLFNDSNPDFPNHHPDPCVESNLIKLKEKVLEVKADVGVAYDGDGDRVGIVDELGNMIETDKYMIIMWRDIYNKVSKKEGFYDVKCSKALEDELIKLGVKPICYRTGNSYTREFSVRGDYPLGGEYSGHVLFRDRFPGFDDGIYASLRLIEVLSNTDKNLSSLLEGINKYYSSNELKRQVADEIKFKIIDKVKEYCQSKNYNILTIDGVKALFEDGSALVRASNTGPNIVMRYEAKTQERYNKIATEFEDLLDNLLKK